MVVWFRCKMVWITQWFSIQDDSKARSNPYSKNPKYLPLCSLLLPHRLELQRISQPLQKLWPHTKPVHLSDSQVPYSLHYTLSVALYQMTKSTTYLTALPCRGIIFVFVISQRLRILNSHFDFWYGCKDVVECSMYLPLLLVVLARV